jgi:hypothetical protein
MSVLFTYIVPYGLVVRIPAFHAGGPGSIPGVGKFLFSQLLFMILFILKLHQCSINYHEKEEEEKKDVKINI